VAGVRAGVEAVAGVTARRAALVLAVAGCLLMPASAQASPWFFAAAPPVPFARAAQGGGICGCVIRVTNWYTTNAYSFRRIAQRAMRRRGINRPWRRRVNRGVYDFERGGYGSKGGWCKRNARACRAVLACIGAATITYLNAPTPQAPRVTAHQAAKACGVAAAVSLVSP
jgi:hypothetical protein